MFSRVALLSLILPATLTVSAFAAPGRPAESKNVERARLEEFHAREAKRIATAKVAMARFSSVPASAIQNLQRRILDTESATEIYEFQLIFEKLAEKDRHVHAGPRLDTAVEYIRFRATYPDEPVGISAKDMRTILDNNQDKAMAFWMQEFRSRSAKLERLSALHDALAGDVHELARFSTLLFISRSTQPERFSPSQTRLAKEYLQLRARAPGITLTKLSYADVLEFLVHVENNQRLDSLAERLALADKNVAYELAEGRQANLDRAFAEAPETSEPAKTVQP